MTSTAPSATSTATTSGANDLPGPPTVRTLGEYRTLRTDGLSWVEARRARYGDIFALRPPLGLAPLFVFACSPSAIRSALTDPATFPKESPVYEEMAASLGDGLLTSEGDRWKAQRRTLQPLFTRKRVAAYGDAFVDAASSVVADWPTDGRVDLDRQMQRVSLRSVSVTLFGTDVTDQVEPIVEAVDVVSALLVKRGTSPIRLPRWAPVPDNRRRKAAEDELTQRIDDLVRRSRESGTRTDDLVSLLVHATDPETGEHLSDVDIREQALVHFVAGYDTTSTAMTFALHLLGHHREWQDRIREEVRGIAGDRPLTTEDVPRLEVTRRCVDEALRLHPSAYITSRSMTADTELDGHPIPAGTVVATSFHALHRNPSVWDDPARFDPDRFLPERVAERDTYAYLPFGGGPRACIGSHFALLEATLGIATIVAARDITTSPVRVPVTLGVTQRPSAPVGAEVRAV